MSENGKQIYLYMQGDKVLSFYYPEYYYGEDSEDLRCFIDKALFFTRHAPLFHEEDKTIIGYYNTFRKISREFLYLEYNPDKSLMVNIQDNIEKIRVFSEDHKLLKLAYYDFDSKANLIFKQTKLQGYEHISREEVYQTNDGFLLQVNSNLFHFSIPDSYVDPLPAMIKYWDNLNKRYEAGCIIREQFSFNGKGIHTFKNKEALQDFIENKHDRFKDKKYMIQPIIPDDEIQRHVVVSGYAHRTQFEIIGIHEILSNEQDNRKIVIESSIPKDEELIIRKNINYIAKYLKHFKYSGPLHIEGYIQKSFEKPIFKIVFARAANTEFNIYWSIKRYIKSKTIKKFKTVVREFKLKPNVYFAKLMPYFAQHLVKDKQFYGIFPVCVSRKRDYTLFTLMFLDSSKRVKVLEETSEQLLRDNNFLL